MRTTPPPTVLVLPLAALVLAGCASPPAASPPPAVVEVTSAAEVPTDDATDPRVAELAKQIEQFAASVEAPPALQPEPTPVPPPIEPPPATVVSDVPPIAAAAPMPQSEPAVEDWPEPTRTPPPPAATAAPDGVAEAVARRLRENPDSPAAAFDAALLRLLDAGEADRLTFDGGALRPSDERIVGQMAEHLAAFRDALADAEHADPAGRVAPILDAADALRREAGLTLPRVALCREVRSFGDYDPADAALIAGQSERALLYVEVEGFGVEPLADLWRTRMTLSAVLYDPEGRPAMSLPPMPVVDEARRPRRDFFLCGPLVLPPDLRPGTHYLKVTVRDDIARRVAQASLTVEVTPAGGGTDR